MKTNKQTPKMARRLPGTNPSDQRLAASLAGADSLAGLSSHHRSPTGTARRCGFTIIEMIAVLAIIAILATMLLDSVTNQMGVAAINAEGADLANMNVALMTEVTHNFTIPSGTNWTQVLAPWFNAAPQAIATNANGYARAYVYDPTGFGSMTLPWTQQTGLTAFPPAPRVIIISAMDTNAPVPSGAIATASFNAIWTNTPGSIPNDATYWTNYTGKAKNLVIQRLNLLPLFKQVVLSPVDTNDFGNFVVQSGTNPVSNNIFVVTNGQNGANNSWYVQGTVINLNDTNILGGVTNITALTTNIETTIVVQGDISYVFEDARWRGLLTGWGTNGPGALFAGTTTVATNQSSINISQTYTGCCHQFCQCSRNNRDSCQGDTCQSCQSCCDKLMQDYNSWCQQGFTCGNYGYNNSCTCNALYNDYQCLQTCCNNMCQ